MLLMFVKQSGLKSLLKKW